MQLEKGSNFECQRKWEGRILSEKRKKESATKGKRKWDKITILSPSININSITYIFERG